jgi:hypothetical protein
MLKIHVLMQLFKISKLYFKRKKPFVEQNKILQRFLPTTLQWSVQVMNEPFVCVRWEVGL